MADQLNEGGRGWVRMKMGWISLPNATIVAAISVGCDQVASDLKQGPIREALLSVALE